MRRSNFEGGGKGRPIVKYRDTAVNCAKTAEPIEMPFGLWTLVCPRKHVFDGGSRSACELAIFRVEDMPRHV